MQSLEPNSYFGFYPKLHSHYTCSVDNCVQREGWNWQRREVRQLRHPHVELGEAPVQREEWQLPSAHGMGKRRLG